MLSADFFKRLEDDELLVNSIASLGWAFWPYRADGSCMGYFDPDSLRALAAEIEARNKPFWDEYEKYCEEHASDHLYDELVDFDFKVNHEESTS